MSTPGLRQRTGKPSAASPATSPTPTITEDERSGISLLDILRILATLITVSCALSYYLTTGTSLLWGYHAWYTNPSALAAYLKGPVNLTPAQLAQYDGTDETKPIYLAING